MSEATYPVAVTTFYRFAPLSGVQLNEWEEKFRELAGMSDLRGLIISAVEGLNSTVAGSDKTIESLKSLVRSIPGFAETIFKDSRAAKNPFKRFKIKRRDEIVTLKRPEFVPQTEYNNHISPEEWDRILREDDDYVLIDTRNGYEVELGAFEGALDPHMHAFSEFGDFVDASGIPKEKKVLMYCTGGIRCEKAIFEMQSKGYEQVYQLEGGILNYLKQFPRSKFQGECFVFDHRVAVDQDLMPSTRWSLCPHCGDPGDERVVCCLCDKEVIICEECAKLPSGKTCSKNCAHHFLAEM